MPYNDISELPKYIKKYPPKIQRMFMKVFNSSYKKYKDEGKAFTLANAIVKKNMEKFGSARYGHNGYIQFMIDKFLKNIWG